MKPWNFNFSAQPPIEILEKMEHQNQKVYAEATTEFKTECLTKHPFLVPVFLQHQTSFLVKGYQFTEALTAIYYSPFANTMDFVELKTTTQSKEQARVYLENLNHLMWKNYQYLLTSLWATRKKVQTTALFQEVFEKVMTEATGKFLQFFTQFLSQKAVPLVLETVIRDFFKVKPTAFLWEKFEIEYFELVAQTQTFLNDQLTQSLKLVYAQLKRTLDPLNPHQKFTKQPFADFDAPALYLKQISNATQALKVLDLPTSASWTEIKHQYKQLAKQYHPDYQGNEKKFKQLVAAYEFLKKNYQENGENKHF